jgi:Major tropism determinant N-terminal domain
MPTVVQFRRGTTAQNNNFLGANGEISVDTTLHVLRVADGATQGGFAMVGQDCVQTIANKTYTGTSLSVTGNVTGGNIVTGGAIAVTGASTAGSYSTSGNITGGNITNGNITITGANIVSTGPTLYIDPNGAGGTDGNVIIAGNLTVQGTTTTINSNTVTTNDLFINVANNAATSSAANGGGLGVGPAGAEYATLTFNNAATAWNMSIPLSVTGNVTASGHVGSIYTNSIVNTGANGTGNVGSASTYFNTVFAKATSAQYADLAEMYCADSDYAPGTLVEFGGNFEVTATIESHSTRVAGIISTNPSYLMNSTIACEINAVAVALTGRVPCQVVGAISKGDRLVASGLHVGVATALDMSQYQPGCIIGKALENYNSTEVGTIEVAVGRT